MPPCGNRLGNHGRRRRPWTGACGWREGHAALTGEAVVGAEDTGSTPAGRGCGSMKTVAGAAGDAEAGEGEAPAAAKAAAALCCAGVEARVRSPGPERRKPKKSAKNRRKKSAGRDRSSSAEAWALAGR
jgi:hypothetical protein